MTPRLKKVSRIARLIDHQKEVIEFQVREIANLQTLEKKRMAVLETELDDHISRFQEGLNHRTILNSEEVAFLFGRASTIFHEMEHKKEELDRIEKELSVLQLIFLEAFKKKKAIEIIENKILAQERRMETVLEQKNMDYLNLSSRSRP
jgi:hypothetical protein